jgi:hypothetical protein
MAATGREKMSTAPKFVEITIAGRVLKLSPLKSEFATAFSEACEALWGAGGRAPFRGALNKAIGEAISFVFVSARPNHPDVTLEELTDEATAWEAYAAIRSLEQLMGDDNGKTTIATKVVNKSICGHDCSFAALKLKELRELQKAREVLHLEEAAGHHVTVFDLFRVWKPFLVISMERAGSTMPDVGEMDFGSAKEFLVAAVQASMEASGTPMASFESTGGEQCQL